MLEVLKRNTPRKEDTLRRSSSGRGRTVYTEIGIWWTEGNNYINLTIPGLENGHVAISGDVSKPYGHPKLYARLVQALTQMGAPHPGVISAEDEAAYAEQDAEWS
jgi:hypothetical protein